MAFRHWISSYFAAGKQRGSPRVLSLCAPSDPMSFDISWLNQQIDAITQSRAKEAAQSEDVLAIGGHRMRTTACGLG